MVAHNYDLLRRIGEGRTYLLRSNVLGFPVIDKMASVHLLHLLPKQHAGKHDPFESGKLVLTLLVFLLACAECATLLTLHAQVLTRLPHIRTLNVADNRLTDRFVSIFSVGNHIVRLN